jgi:hypothetical protein
MSQATFQDIRLSTLFTDLTVRRAFERAERDTPPESLAVEVDHAPRLAPGAFEMVEA